MITPVIINRLAYRAYLIFTATNLAFIPLVYFCYPETAGLTLEEIDFLFVKPDESAVRISRRIWRERKSQGGRRASIVGGAGTGAGPAHRGSDAGDLEARFSAEEKKSVSGA